MIMFDMAVLLNHLLKYKKNISQSLLTLFVAVLKLCYQCLQIFEASEVFRTGFSVNIVLARKHSFTMFRKKIKRKNKTFKTYLCFLKLHKNYITSSFYAAILNLP